RARRGPAACRQLPCELRSRTRVRSCLDCLSRHLDGCLRLSTRSRCAHRASHRARGARGAEVDRARRVLLFRRRLAKASRDCLRRTRGRERLKLRWSELLFLHLAAGQGQCHVPYCLQHGGRMGTPAGASSSFTITDLMRTRSTTKIATDFCRVAIQHADNQKCNRSRDSNDRLTHRNLHWLKGSRSFGGRELKTTTA